MRTVTIKFISLLFALFATPQVLSSEDRLGRISGNEFNPAISLILDARYTHRDEGELELPGFQLGGETGLPARGFSSGHNELVFSANIDDKFFGQTTLAIVEHDGIAELELEEAFIETLGLGSGFTIKGGKFFSGIGYLNGIHLHAHDFTDRPLVYDGMMGGYINDTGVQLRWVAPTDFYLSVGAELLSGSSFPGGENDRNNRGRSVFVKTGGDLSESSSWMLGASSYESQFHVREAGGHGHGSAGDVHNELKDGEVDIAGIDFVYKWAPNGNPQTTNFKFQAEYFVRNESGEAEFHEGDEEAEADYEGKQKGFYAQAIYQFMPAWRVGVRYDYLKASNDISNFIDKGIDEDEFLDESGLGADEDPKKYSVMFDYSPSHFSRIRLQYSQLNAGHDDKNNIVTLQYVMSLGAHGAHTF